MWILILTIFLTVSNGEIIPQVLQDEFEYSGDYGTEVSYNIKTPDPSVAVSRKNIMKAFTNGQQNRQLSTKINPKLKQQNRRNDLNEDINDFIDLLPKADIKSKLEEYYRNDMDIQNIFEFMHSKEFQELRKSILELSDVREALNYLNKNGLNVKSVLRKLDNRLGISKIRTIPFQHISQQALGTNTTIGGINSLIEDILSVLPQDELFILFFEKLDSSPKFASFIQSIGDPAFQHKYTTLWKSKDLHSASNQLKKHKVDIVKIIQIIQGFFIFGTF